MTVREGAWPPGAPAWVSLSTPDVGAATGFYGDLLGWGFRRGETSDGRTYLTAVLGGLAVAGIGQSTEPDAPAQWTVFLGTTDAGTTADAAIDAGGEVLVEATDAPGSGTAALLADPTGAVVGVWQPGDHPGLELTDEPGAVLWCELVTPDLGRAQDFYGAVFGLSFAAQAGVPVPYVTAHTAEGPAAGLGEPDPDIGWDGTPHWLVYLAHPDVDAAVAVAQAHGGRAERDPFDSPFGRIVVLRGPSGERLALMTPEDSAPQASEPQQEAPPAGSSPSSR